MELTDKDRKKSDKDSPDSPKPAPPPPRGTKNESRQEKASKDADVGRAPEQSDTREVVTKPRSEHRDRQATYEPDKRPSDRETH